MCCSYIILGLMSGLLLDPRQKIIIRLVIENYYYHRIEIIKLLLDQYQELLLD